MGLTLFNYYSKGRLLRNRISGRNAIVSQIYFYLDEDTINTALVKAMRNVNLDVVTVADAGRLGYPDEDQLVWATEKRRVIYSFNIEIFTVIASIFIAQAGLSSNPRPFI